MPQQHGSRTQLPYIVFVHWALLAVLLVVSLYQATDPTIEHQYLFNEQESQPVDLQTAHQPAYQEVTLSDGATKEVHSGSITEIAPGRFKAFWYGGSREGAKDVKIYTANGIQQGDDIQWASSQVVMTPKKLAQETHRSIKKVGNAVTIADQDGRLWVFFVSVSVGGWAGSSINYIVSDSQGLNWSQAQRLITSPFLNLSTLVRDRPFLYANGDIGLPIYHEFIGKFSEFLRVTPQGQVTTKTRITWGRESLQPSKVILDNQKAMAWMRYAGKGQPRTLISETDDGGATWSEPKESNIPNPDAGTSAISANIDHEGVLVVFNNSEEGRHRLSLGYTTDKGENWLLLKDIAKSPPHKGRFSYPQIIPSQTDGFHILYTWNRTQIQHVYFNQQWVLEQVQRANTTALQFINEKGPLL